MKSQFLTTLFIGILFLLNSCSTAPKKIDYGNDGCHYCKMTIVDQIYGAELITDKGKTFKFDALECLINFAKDNSAIQNSSLYTNYYEVPTEFISVEEATFLISKNLPSPMGANLTAFKNPSNASAILKEKDGKLYNWEELKKVF
jgi:copper chaperone NosL